MWIEVMRSTFQVPLRSEDLHASGLVPAAGLAMRPCPTCLWVLVLCLAQTIHMQNRVLPKPSISAEPRPAIHWGQPVTIVCQGPAGADLFRLENKENISVYWDQKITSQHGSQGAEARFCISAVSDDTARSYWCRYRQETGWSELSEPLELKVADEENNIPLSGAPRVVSSTPFSCTKPPTTAESSTSRAALEGTGHTQTNSPDTKTSILSPELLYILVGICVASLLCLLLLAFLLVHRQRQKKPGTPSSKDEEPRPQERLSPTDDITESPADVATTVDVLPEENGDMHSPSPAAGDPQEVTYAQLDQWALTRRAAHTESPQPTEPTAESSVYATLPGH
ncbi:leukocyte-associated immunoglobulin-like receptor 1 isoform X2 [Phyllostomus hastatus]|uniref:leukocyte-associated immunoglobulin-like receptor 1 isoform X2 n=1 Tax=Phyllostomus hastatus TaxID=9423 RepID=UPI001E681C0D|nr:leukocyte-associated immunoglobulin-like receptor 1 isoform X2 [Phyllostomus hastatus]